MNQIITENLKETAKVAEEVMSKIDFDKINKPVVLALRGELGGGKTVFSKSVGKILGVKETITSPTFIIFNEYKVGKNKFGIEKFLHFDLYRIEEGFELDEIAFFDQFYAKSVICIEWPERMGKKNLEKLRKMAHVIDIRFEYRHKETERKIRIDL
jgi:tRNA threonylcarbamoyladenosine biosynthesis protein TsaE